MSACGTCRGARWSSLSTAVSIPSARVPPTGLGMPTRCTGSCRQLQSSSLSRMSGHARLRYSPVSSPGRPSTPALPLLTSRVSTLVPCSLWPAPDPATRQFRSPLVPAAQFRLHRSWLETQLHHAQQQPCALVALIVETLPCRAACPVTVVPARPSARWSRRPQPVLTSRSGSSPPPASTRGKISPPDRGRSVSAGHPRAITFLLPRCDMLGRGLAPRGSFPCWAIG
jgi:hypothetical protein